MTLSAFPSTHHDPLLRIIIHSTESRLVGRFNQSFATWGNSGIEPDEGKGISSPGRDEVNLMGPRNNGERQWHIMWGWTCR
jgi:hypothetical protein